MPNNRPQTTGQYADAKQQPLKNDNQRPKTNDRFDALVEQLNEDEITFHQSGTTDDKTTTNRQLARTVDKSNSRKTNSIDFNLKTNIGNIFALNSKIRDEKRFPMNFIVLCHTLQLDKKQNVIRPLMFKTYEINALLYTRAVQSAMSGAEHRTVTIPHPETILGEMSAQSSKFRSPTATLSKSKKEGS